MARLPMATREAVPQGQQDTFDEIVQRMGEMPRYGPPSVTIHVPQAHKLTFALNDYLRRDGCLPLKVQELAMLVAAREMDCQHIWNAHAASARGAGVPDALVDALRDKQPLPAMANDEAAVVYMGREFFRTHKVSRGAFQTALEQFGQQGVVELALVLGQYSMLAFCINTFDTDLPPDRTEPLLPV